MAGSVGRPLLFLDIDGTLISLANASRDPAAPVERTVAGSDAGGQSTVGPAQ